MPERGAGKRGTRLTAVIEDSEDEGLGDSDDRELAGDEQNVAGGEDPASEGPDWMRKGGKVLSTALVSDVSTEPLN